MSTVPLFSFQAYIVQIPEDTFPLANVLTVHASDVDTGNNGKVVYSIKGEGSDTFTVDPSEGNVMVRLFLTPNLPSFVTNA